jgi:hypothetical protein
MLSTIKVNSKPLSIISKLYVWSILLESFLYFVLTHPSTFGFGASVARILQIVVILYLVLKINNEHLLQVINPFSLFNYKFSLYFLYTIIVSIVAYIFYEYDLAANFRLEAVKRQLFEFIVQLYYFIYFAVLPRFFITSRRGVEYFFKVFFITFFLTVFVGILDLLYYDFLGENLLSRQVWENVGVGFRFHGFNGEPRDAYVYLVLSVSLFAMYSIWKQQSLSKILMTFIAFLIIMTQSFSFIIGMIILAALLPVYYAKYNNMKINILILFGYFVSVFIIVIASLYSYRLGLYFKAFPSLYFNLSHGLFLKGVLQYQMVNIIPIWDIWLKLASYNPFPLLFGHGSGSSFVVNNAYLMVIWEDTELDIINPHAQIIRSIYEYGIVGTLLFISFLISPFKKNMIRVEDFKKFIFITLLVLAAFFSHRVVAPYILFGIASVIFPLIRNESINIANQSKIFNQK